MKYDIKAAFDAVCAEHELKAATTKSVTEYLQSYDKRIKTARLRLSALCAAFLLALTSGLYIYFDTAAYVDVDLNPSFELKLNRLGLVLDASPYNKDGAQLLRNARLKHKTYAQAMSVVLEEMQIEGYVKANKLISVTVQANAKKTQENIINGVKAAVNYFIDSSDTDADTDIFPVSEQVKLEALGHQMTPAKYVALAQLVQVDPTATFEDCAGHSITEIKNKIHDHEKKGDNVTSAQSSGQLTMPRDAVPDIDTNKGEYGHRHQKGHNRK